MSLPVPFDVVHKIVVPKDKQYLGWIGNEHHWTTEYVWESFIPTMFVALNIEFDSMKFKKVKLNHGNFDLSYHDIIEQQSIEIVDFSQGNVLAGDFSVVRNIENCHFKSVTPYHQLFSLAHRCGLIRNKTINTHNKLVINTDSMSVPVIPILSCFFREIFVVDFRGGNRPDFEKVVSELNPSHFVNLFMDLNCILGGKKFL